MLESSGSHYDVVIIGGGFTGTALATQLLRSATSPISIAIVERSSLRARGIAYSTSLEHHLLNVPAGKMSVFPDDADHFYRWAKANYDSKLEAGTFAPRRVYGQYLEATLKETQADSVAKLHWIRDEAHAISASDPNVESASEIQLASGPILSADYVALALGNFRPSDPRLPGKNDDARRYFPFAWDDSALEDLPTKGDILLVGSGLTCVDTALSLRARRFTGAIHILSRRGLLPRRHRAAATWPAFWNANSPRTVTGLVRLIRQQVRAAHDQGVDWRAVVDSLRPFISKIWASLPLHEKRRFLRHARPYWEVHRHRVAPEIGDFLGAEIADHHMQTHAGHIIKYDEKADHVIVTYSDRIHGKEARLRVHRVVNCTGPETDTRRLNHPLLNQLFSSGLARPDELFLGFDVTSDGAIVDRSGQPSKFLYAVGPARKGSLWETTAVPEIRVQVAQLAAHLSELLPASAGVSSVEIETIAPQQL